MVVGPLSRVAVSIFLFLSVFAWGQQVEEPASPGAAPRSSAVLANSGVPEGRIKLDVVVTDKAGQPIAGLDSKDFTLLDDKKPVRIVSFRAYNGTNAQPDPPPEVILLFDYVNDELVNITSERHEVEEFLQENGGHLAQPVSIFVLRDTGLQALRQPSTDGNELAAEIEKLPSSLRVNTHETGANGEVERYNESLKAMSGIAAYEMKKPGRKLLFWIGPGWPLLDSPHFKDANDATERYFKAIVDFSTNLREAQIAVYSVGISQYGFRFVGGPASNSDKSSGTLKNTGLGAQFVEESDDSDPLAYEGYLKGIKEFWQAKAGDLSVKVLATQNGGRVLGLDNGLKSQIDSCIRDAATFYRLSFDPPRARKADEYHALDVQMDKPGLNAHTSTAYYNQP